MSGTGKAREPGDSLASGLYYGWVRHRRFTPRRHQFRYRVFMVYADLSELASLLSLSRWWSARRLAPARFRREDFHGDSGTPLSQAVLDTVEQQLGFRPTGPVRMLANFRYFGYNMNPLVNYYCFDQSGSQLQAILAEVTNTPWNEKHAYGIDCRASEGKPVRTRFDKAFTVSPFNPLNMRYHWSSDVPGESVNLHIATELDGQCTFDADMQLERVPATAASLNRALIRHPLMTVKVISAIYWEALWLFIKGVPFLGKDKVARTETQQAFNERNGQ